MTENRRFRPGEDPPPEPGLGTDPVSRRPNGLDHMGFLLQVVQVVPIMMSLFGLFLTSVWALRVTTAATLLVAWGTIMLLSHEPGGVRDRRRRHHRDRRQRRPPRPCRQRRQRRRRSSDSRSAGTKQRHP